MSDPASLRAAFDAALAACQTPNDVKQVRDSFLSRKHGSVTALVKGIASATPDERRVLGAAANALKQHIEQMLDARELELAAAAPVKGAVDITLPGRVPAIGRRHPLTQVRERIEDIFAGMGYTILEGPELEDDWHNFEALNMPPEHPARDMQDTLYLSSPVATADPKRPATLLRTHTSGMQIRYMEAHQPPVRIIAPGRVYRRDNFDATHTPMFTQVEGLVVDEGISLGDLKGTLNAFAERFFDAKVKTRFRPSFFPYTEPSAELDVECQGCNGRGCGLCKHTGWIEVLGCGMVHPAVFESVGYDTEKYTGFAFGMGIERLALRRYGIDDIRMFYENDLRFLEQLRAMKLPLSWLKDFAAVPADVNIVASKFAACGFAVDGIEGDVLDLDVTANRPDCLSMLGLAREAATAFDVALKDPSAAAKAEGSAGPASIKVSLADAGCGRYALAVADVKVGPSPAWIAERLAAAGVRPINNVVDITNYVMLELGQPMHAFDAARLAGPEIHVRRARPDEKLTTLDGVERKLDETMLVIADRDRAVALAGVMGGATSEVSGGTTRIAIESAWFRPQIVRAMSRKLGLKTEASARFERGADINAPARALRRALALIQETGAGNAVGGVTDVYPRPAETRRVTLRRARIARLLGQAVPDQDAERLLTHLGFTLSANIDGWDVDVPSFRVDVAREADLIEEVGRHWGLDRVPATFPELRTMPDRADAGVTDGRLVRRLLCGAGVQEAVTFTFMEAGWAAPFAPADQIVAIANPLSEKFGVLRPALLPGLIDSVAYSRRRESADVRLFEVGAVFVPGGESQHAGWALVGSRGEHWTGSAGQLGFSDTRGLAELVASAFGVTALDFAADDRLTWLVNGRRARVSSGGVELGWVGQSAVQRGVPDGDVIWAGELDLGALRGLRGSTTHAIDALPRFPSIVRDLSIVVEDRLPAAEVRATIRANAPSTLVSVREFDRYQGKGVPDGHVSLSLRLTFRDTERTLTDVDVQPAVDQIVAALARDHRAVLRGKS